MNHLGTEEIITPRLLLRRFTLADAEAMYANWGSDEAVNLYMNWPLHHSVADSLTVLKEWVARYVEKDHYQWAIEPHQLGKPIGSIGANFVRDEVELAHIGYCIGSRWWGMGLVSEAFSAVIDFMFIQAGFNRIEARHDARNPASGRVMAKCGLRYEGTHRQGERNNQGLEDAVWYAILREDFFRERGMRHD